MNTVLYPSFCKFRNRKLFFNHESLVPSRTSPHSQMLADLSTLTFQTYLPRQKKAYRWIELSCTTKQAAAILGPQGKRLNKIRSITGCQIRLDPVDTDGVQLLSIRHKHEILAVEQAIQLIHLALNVFCLPSYIVGHIRNFPAAIEFLKS